MILASLKCSDCINYNIENFEIDGMVFKALHMRASESDVIIFLINITPNDQTTFTIKCPFELIFDV